MIKYLIHSFSITDVKDGIASLVYSFSTEGTKTVTAKFSAEGYYDSSASTQVNVKVLSTTLTARDVTADYNEAKRLVATLKNKRFEKGRKIRHF